MPGDELLSCALSGVVLMQWHEKYIGIPFENGGRSFLGCDCGGLVLLMLKTERGIHAKDMLEVYERQELHTRDGQERLSHMIGDSLSEWVLLPKGTEPKRWTWPYTATVGPIAIAPPWLMPGTSYTLKKRGLPGWPPSKCSAQAINS